MLRAVCGSVFMLMLCTGLGVVFGAAYLLGAR